MTDLAAQAADAAQHAGELTPGIIATISGASGGLARIIATALPANPRTALTAAVAISTVSLGIWIYSASAMTREGAFPLFVGWGVVLAATFGIFTGSNAATMSGAVNTLTAGRMGTAKDEK